RAQEVLRAQGARRFLLLALKKLWGLCRSVLEIRRFFFFENDLTQPLPLLPARLPLTIRPLRGEEVETFAAAFRAQGLAPEIVHRWLAQGETCILALAGERLVNFAWIICSTAVWLGEIGVTLCLAPGECYGHNFVTVPEWRGQGINPAVGSFLLHYERSRGCSRNLFYVLADNRASLQSIAKLPSTRTKTLWSIRVRGRKRPFILGATQKGSPSFARPAYPG